MSSSIPLNDMKIAIGWAIIVSGEDLNLGEKVKADEDYLKNMLFMFDLKIILMTFGLFRKNKRNLLMNKFLIAYNYVES